MMKNYLLKLLEQCSEEQFGQDAIEWAINTGVVRLTYESDADVRSIMLRYDELIEAYRQAKAQGNEGLRGFRRAPAPMKRALPRRQVGAKGTRTSVKRTKAA